MNLVRLAAVTAAVMTCAGSAWSAPLRALDGRRLTPAGIDATMQRLLQANGVKGLSVALIRDGRVVYLRSYGRRDAERGLPLTPDTVTYGASLTKATFAYLVMQLVDEGRLDLDRPIAAYLPKPLPAYAKYADLAGDDRWRRLTARILLNHTSGFANFRWLEPDEKLRFHADPGARYGYSGEGIGLLQFVLEEGLGLDVGQEIQRRVFNRFGMGDTSMIWRPAAAENLAQGYGANGELVPHAMRSKAKAAGSMDTTARDWSAFLAAVVRGEGLSRRAKAEMIRRSVAIQSVSQFPTLRPDTTTAWRSIRLGYGVGWGVFESPYGHAFFKEGHDDGTANYALCVEDRKACILLLSNSVRAEAAFKPIIEYLMGDVRFPWAWEGYGPAA